MKCRLHIFLQSFILLYYLGLYRGIVSIIGLMPDPAQIDNRTLPRCDREHSTSVTADSRSPGDIGYAGRVEDLEAGAIDFAGPEGVRWRPF